MVTADWATRSPWSILSKNHIKMMKIFDLKTRNTLPNIFNIGTFIIINHSDQHLSEYKRLNQVDTKGNKK